MKLPTHAPRIAMKTLTLLVVIGTASSAAAQGYPVFAGDPVNAATGRAHPILPGLPLVLPQNDGRYRPPIVVPGTVGDVDLVVRAGSPPVASDIPAPADPPLEVVAGGEHVASGGEMPFTVIVSDGSASPVGNPLLGPEMDGIPVLVAAFADLDGDGIVGPTGNDPAGNADDLREEQEALYPVGLQLAVFDGGVARGSIALWNGAPASSGGLTVVLTAMAYVGPYTSLLDGAVPDGPPVATLLPFFPRFDPERVIDGDGNGGPGIPGERFSVSLEPEFDGEDVEDVPELAEAFAIPADGSSPTVDRVVVHAAPFSRARFVRPSQAAGFPGDTQVPLHVGAGGALFEPLATTAIGDDGAGGGVTVRLVPVDVLDDVTDPPHDTTLTLVAGAGAVITSPDGDGDPSRETITLAAAAGADVTIDDAGDANDSGSASTLAVVVGGYPTEILDLQITPGGGGAAAPAIVFAQLAGQPANLVARCPVAPRLVVVVSDPQGDADTVSTAYAIDGSPAGGGMLTPSQATIPFLPPGKLYRGRLGVARNAGTTASVTLTARDAAGNDSTPVTLSLPVVVGATPDVADVSLLPAAATTFVRSDLLVRARITDDCGVQRVVAEVDQGAGYKRVATLRDDGRHGDAVAGDGTYTGRIRRRFTTSGDLPVRVSARNRLRVAISSAPVTLTVTP